MPDSSLLPSSKAEAEQQLGPFQLSDFPFFKIPFSFTLVDNAGKAAAIAATELEAGGGADGAGVGAPDGAGGNEAGCRAEMRPLLLDSSSCNTDIMWEMP